MRLLVVALLLSSCSLAFGQNKDSIAIRNFYNENALFWPGGFNKYRQGGKWHKFQEMEEVIRFSPEATLDYHKFMSNRRTSLILMTTSIVLLTSSIFVKDQQARIGLAAGAVFTAGISIPFARRWTFYLNRTIWVHNRDMLIR